MNNNANIRNLKLEELPELLSYVCEDEDGDSRLSDDIKYLRNILPTLVTENCIGDGELDEAIEVVGCTITHLDRLLTEITREACRN